MAVWGRGAAPCLPPPHRGPGALSHVCLGPEVLHCPLSSSEAALTSAQRGMCPWSACWLSAGGRHLRVCGGSAVGQCQEAAVDTKHTTNRIPVAIQDTVLPVTAVPTSSCSTVSHG